MKKHWGAIMLTVLALIVIYLYVIDFKLPCLGNCTESIGTDTLENRTYTDTTYFEIEKEVRVPVDSLVIVYDTTDVPFNFDTAAIIKDYFTRKYVTFNYNNDTVSIQFEDSLYRNNITYRNFVLDLNIPVIVDSTYVEVERKVLPYSLYGGIEIALNSSIQPTLLYNTGKYQFSAGYNLSSQQLVLGAYIGLK